LTTQDESLINRPRKACGWCIDYGLVERIPLLTLKFDDLQSITIVGTEKSDLLVTEPWVAMTMARPEYVQRFEQDCHTCQSLKILSITKDLPYVYTVIRPSLTFDKREIPLDVSGVENERVMMKHKIFRMSDHLTVKTSLGYGPKSKTWVIGPVALYGRMEGREWSLLSSDVRS
jgi:hypothetical protein